MDQENNDLEALDQEETALRNEAMQIDPVRPEDKNQLDDVHTGKQAAGNAEPTAKETDKSKAEKPTDDKQQQKAADKSDTDKAKDKQTPADKANSEEDEDDPKLTPFEKAKRRQNKAWKEITATKDQLKKERETLEAERKAFEKTKTERAQPPEKPKHNGFTAEDYDDVAKDFEAEGKLAERDKAKAIADKLRAEEQKQKQGDEVDESKFVKLATGGRITQQEQAAMTQQWQTNLQRLGKEFPAMTEEGTPLRAEVTRLLKEFPILHTSGDGIAYAVQIADLSLKAAQVPELEKQLTELKAENTRLTELTSLNPSASGRKPEQRKIGDLPLEDAEQALREEAMAADARGAG